MFRDINKNIEYTHKICHGFKRIRWMIAEIYGTEMMEMQFNPERFNNITRYEEIGNYGYE